MNKLSNYFVRGLISLVPLVITYYVIATVFTFIESSIEEYIPVKFPGMGLILLVTVILIVGWFSVNCTWGVSILFRYIESLLDRIPIVKFIYSTVKRVSTMLFESKSMFSQVVLVPYPHPGVKSLGFLMTGINAEMAEKLGAEEYESVFIPWSLNMSSGFNVLVPKKDLIFLDLAVEDAFQYILTAGGVVPGGDVPEGMQHGLPVVVHKTDVNEVNMGTKISQVQQNFVEKEAKVKKIKKRKHKYKK